MAECPIAELSDSELDAAAKQATLLGNQHGRQTKYLSSTHLARTEAVALCRERLRRKPGQLLSCRALALALIEVAATSKDLDENDDAVEAATEAADLLRQLLTSDLLASEARVQLSIALSSLTRSLAELGRYGEAISRFVEAVAFATAASANPAPEPLDTDHLDDALYVFWNRDLIREQGTEAIAALDTCLRSSIAHWLNLEASAAGIRWVSELLGTKANIEEKLGWELDAAKTRTEMIALLRQVIAIAPDHAEAIEDLGDTLIELGRHECEIGNYNAARNHALEAGLVIATRLATDDHEFRRSTYAQSRQLVLLGEIEYRLGNATAARAAYRVAISLRRTILDGGYVPYGHDYMLSRAVAALSDLELAEGDLEAAEAAWRDVVNPLDPGWVQLLEPLGHRTIIDACDGLAYLARRRDDYISAYALHAQALTLDRECAERAKRNTPSLRNLVIALGNLSDDVYELVGSDATIDLLTEWVEVAREWQARAEGTADMLEARCRLADGLERLGTAEMLRQDYDSALALCIECVQLHRQWIVESRDCIEARLALAAVLNDLGNAEFASRQFPAALAAYEESARLQHNLLATVQEQDRSDRQVALIFAERGIARSAWKLSDHTMALAAAGRGVEACQLEVRNNSTDTQLLQWLFAALERLGRYSSDMKKPAAARDAWREAQAVLATLRSHDQADLDEFDIDAKDRKLADGRRSVKQDSEASDSA